MIKRLCGEAKENNRTSQPKLLEEIQLIETRLKNLEDYFFDQKIDLTAYQSARQRYTSDLELKRKELQNAQTSANDYQSQLKQAISLASNLFSLYQKGTNQQKSTILGSIFPEKLQIDKLECRTARINEALRLIIAVDAGFGHKKSGQLFKNLKLSADVENNGVEPPTNPTAHNRGSPPTIDRRSPPVSPLSNSVIL